MRFLLLALFHFAAFVYSEVSETPNLESIDWILGEWIQQTEQTTTFECWKKEDPTTFRGYGSTTQSGSEKRRTEEYLLLTSLGEEIYYFAKVPHNELPTAFKLTEFSDSHAIFENLEHDFPNRLEYRLIAPQVLSVKVSGSASQGFEINFRRRP